MSDSRRPAFNQKNRLRLLRSVAETPFFVSKQMNADDDKSLIVVPVEKKAVIETFDKQSGYLTPELQFFGTSPGKKDPNLISTLRKIVEEASADDVEVDEDGRRHTITTTTDNNEFQKLQLIIDHYYLSARQFTVSVLPENIATNCRQFFDSNKITMRGADVVFNCQEPTYHSIDEKEQKQKEQKEKLNILVDDEVCKIYTDNQRTMKQVTFPDSGNNGTATFEAALTSFLQKVTGLQDGVIHHTNLLQTSNTGALRQQMHTDYNLAALRSDQDPGFFFLIPISSYHRKSASIYIDATVSTHRSDCQGICLFKVPIEIGSIFIGTDYLIHAGSEEPGRRLHGYFAKRSHPVDDKKTWYSRDPSYPSCPIKEWDFNWE